MTVINGVLTDVSGSPVRGELSARAVSFRADGVQVMSTDVVTFPFEGGELSAAVEPGPTQLTLKVGPVRRTWVSDIPNVPSVGLGVLMGDT